MNCVRKLEDPQSIRGMLSDWTEAKQGPRNANANSAAAKTIILLHGSWTDARCWHKVSPLLEAMGHTVIAIDLPGRGRNPMPAAEVTLQACVETVVRAIDAQSGRVILAGHSRAGVVLSQVAEVRPDRIDGLIYIAAFLLGDGQTVPEVAARDSGSLVAPHLLINEAEGWDSIGEEALRAALYADCSEADFDESLGRFTPEPIAPFLTPLRLTAANYGRVRRSYIELTRDRAVTPALQAAMRRAEPCRQVVTIDAGHCAHLSAPAALARAIHLLA